MLTFISIFKSEFVKIKSHINANFARRFFLSNAYIHIYIDFVKMKATLTH